MANTQEKIMKDLAGAGVNPKVREINNKPRQISSAAPPGAGRMEYIQQIDPDLIGPYSIPSDKPGGGQAFKIKKDEEYESLKEKIAAHGVNTPAIIRLWKYDNSFRYEMLAGHRRQMICKELGIQLPCIIRANLSDDDATIIMTSTNTETRQTMDPSELAWAYRMELNALKHQGRSLSNGNNTSAQNEPKSGMTTAEQVGKARGDSRAKVQRYIRLTYLIPELLYDYVDHKYIDLLTGVALSYLPNEMQEEVLHCLQAGAKIQSVQAETLKQLQKDGTLTAEIVRTNLLGTVQRKRTSMVKIPSARISTFFPKHTKPETMEQALFEAMTIRNEFFPNATLDEIRAELQEFLASRD